MKKKKSNAKCKTISNIKLCSSNKHNTPHIT